MEKKIIDKDLMIVDNVVVSCTTRQEEIYIPEGVVEIGQGAFKGCTSLKKIYMTDSVRIIGAHAFKGCRQLEEIRLSENLLEIGEYGFHRCHRLKEIRIPKSVTRLGNCVFLYCDSLAKVEMTGVKIFGKQTFLNDVAIEELVLSADLDTDSIRECFTGCDHIKRITLVSENGEGVAENTTVEINHIIDILSGNYSIHPVIDRIIRDMYLILQVEEGVLTEYLNNIKRIELPEGITEIGKSCFFDKRGINSVVFPKSLKRIRARAFRGCMGLETVEFLSEDIEIEEEAFLNCSSLKRIKLPHGEEYVLSGIQINEESSKNPIVETIHRQVLENFLLSGSMLLEYRGCEQKVVVPEGVNVIGQRAFAGNEAIDRIELPDSVRYIEREAFKDCVLLQSIKIPRELCKIEEEAFMNCVKLIRIELPEAILNIPKSCFKRCNVLQEVMGLEHIDTIEDMAFLGCGKLEKITLNRNMSSIGDMAFYSCRKLSSISMPDRLGRMGRLVFAKCGQLSDEMMAVDTDSNSGADTGDNRVNRFAVKCNLDVEKLGCISQSDIMTIRENVTVIPEYAFFGREDIRELFLPAGIKSIGKCAFYGCINLVKIHFPQDKIEFGESSFEKCVSLREIECMTDKIPDRCFAWCENLQKADIGNVNIVSKEAFRGCKSLKDYSFDTVTCIGKYAFSMCNSLEKIELCQNTRIGEYAFAMCDRLTYIKLHKGVELGDFCFGDCGNVEKIEVWACPDIYENIDFMKSSSFRGCTGIKYMQSHNDIYKIEGYESIFDVNLPDWVRKIYASAISVFGINGKNHLMSYHGYAARVTIPEGIVKIEREVFRDRETLEEIIIPNSVVSIEARAFDKTEWLRRQREKNSLVIYKDILIDGTTFEGGLTVPEHVNRIAGWAFANNLNLQAITFTRDIEVGEFAFRNCINLRKITLPDGEIYELNSLTDDDRPDLVERIAEECYNCFKMQGDMLVESTGNIPKLVFPKGIKRIDREVYKESNLLTEISLGDEMEELGNSALEQCKWLQSVSGTEKIKVIGSRAFFGCIRLEQIDELKSLEVLGERAFENCCSLKKIVLPEGLRRIPKRAFYRCTSLEQIVIPSTVEEIAEDAFAYCPVNGQAEGRQTVRYPVD